MDKILINGRAGAGKDEIADYLVKEYGYTKITFAEGIYEIARKYFGMTTKDRRLLQNIGQKMREIDPEVWVNRVYNRSKGLNKVVISDCRQENEYKKGIELGFYPIRVFADEDIRKQRIIERDGVIPDMSLLENESENGADHCKYHEVDNNGTKEELYKQVDKLLNKRS